MKVIFKIALLWNMNMGFVSHGNKQVMAVLGKLEAIQDLKALLVSALLLWFLNLINILIMFNFFLGSARSLTMHEET